MQLTQRQWLVLILVFCLSYQAFLSFAVSTLADAQQEVTSPVLEEDGGVTFQYVSKDEESIDLIGGFPVPASVISPVIDEDNTVTFYYHGEANRVRVAGSFTDWQNGALDMARGENNLWSLTLDPLNEGSYAYRFMLNENEWITDPGNDGPKDGDGNSIFVIGQLEDQRIISLAGSFQSAYAESIGERVGNWTPGHPLTELKETEAGSGIFQGTFRLPAGEWGYKVTIKEIADHRETVRWIPEGVGNEKFISLSEPTDVTFIFNYYAYLADPGSTPYTDSISYQPLDVTVYDIDGNLLGRMEDHHFDNVYEYVLGELEAGTYTYSIYVEQEEYHTEVEVTLEQGFNLSLVYYSKNGVLLTNYAPVIDNELQMDQFYHNSHELAYREPFGAVEQGTEVTFRIETAPNDASTVSLILGRDIIPMQRESLEDRDVWTTRASIAEIGISSYYFRLQDGRAIAYYTNVSGFGGEGRATEQAPAGSSGYPFVVFKKGYQTPDWMKNSVTYQVFIERFRNGDPTNDRAKVLGRGDIPLQFPKWNRYTHFENTRAQYVYPEIGEILADGKVHEIDLNSDGFLEYVGDQHWHNDFYGGDLQGLLDSLDYLLSIGVKTIYLNPIFESTSVHKYDTSDYRNVDLMFGDNELFKRVAQEAKRRGMHMILDGVFNHVGDDSKYFDRYGKFPDSVGAYQAWVAREMEKGNKVAIDWYNKWYKEKVEAEEMIWSTESPYDDWFTIHADGTYSGWWGFDSLPEMGVNGDNETSVDSFMDYIIRGDDAVAVQWIEYGSSGWRLDVSPEVEKPFWEEFRQRIKGSDMRNHTHPNGEPIMIAENWGDATADFLGTTFDSTMNYLFRHAVASFVVDETMESKYRDDGITPEERYVPFDAKQLDQHLMVTYEKYPREAFYVLMNLMGSHDVPRILRVFGQIDDDRLLYPGQKNFIADRLDIDQGKMKDVYTIPDIWRLGLKSEQNVKAFVQAQNERAKARLLLATILQMGYPGSPTIYYGDEVGISGYHDPDNRRQMNWTKATPANGLLMQTALLARIRNQHQVLKTGDLHTLLAEEGGQVYVIGRSIEGATDALGRTAYTLNYHTGETLRIADHNGKAIVAINKGDQTEVTVDVNGFVADSTVLYDNLNGNKCYAVKDGRITLELQERSGAILVTEPFNGKIKLQLPNRGHQRHSYEK